MFNSHLYAHAGLCISQVFMTCYVTRPHHHHHHHDGEAWRLAAATRVDACSSSRRLTASE